MKTPSLADVAMPSEDDLAPDSTPDVGDDYSASVAELADLLGVPDDKRDAFSTAFQAAVMTCK